MAVLVPVALIVFNQALSLVDRRGGLGKSVDEVPAGVENSISKSLIRGLKHFVFFTKDVAIPNQTFLGEW